MASTAVLMLLLSSIAPWCVGCGGISAWDGAVPAAGDAGEHDSSGDGFAQDAGSDTDAENAETGCANGDVGVSVMVPEGYSIDAFEVSRCQYAAWLLTGPDVSGQPAACAWNTDFTPSCGWPPGADGALPVSCVDWCDAYAYCKGVGKRLCGKRGGGPNDFAADKDSAANQWYNACTAGGLYYYPYGDEYDADTCLTEEPSGATPVAPGSHESCHSPAPGYSGLFDMSGNVEEWEDSCTQGQAALDQCHVRGGSLGSHYYTAFCAYGGHTRRSESNIGIGFRCCGP